VRLTHAESPFRGLREVLASRQDPYRGIPAEEPRRVGGFMCIASVVLGIGIGMLAPPTTAIGDAGYWVGGAMLASMLVWAALLLRPGSKVGFTGMLAVCYLGVVYVAVAAWLAGGHDTPYSQLYLMMAVFPPSIQPPRRAVALLAFITLALFSPVLYESWSRSDVATVALQASFYWILGLAAMVVVDGIRNQRLGLIAAERRASRQARLDELTGLGNRRAFDEALALEVSRSRRAMTPVCAVSLDLDHFKSINDRFGHLQGDRVLKAVAGVIVAEARKPDLSFRWGGDEFVLLLPDTGRDGGEELGRRLRKAVGTGVRLPNEEPVGISFGVAQLVGNQSAAELLAAADCDLMRVKREHAVA
jgi:diguanylate cyclase (GGDEF)-like protein